MHTDLTIRAPGHFGEASYRAFLSSEALARPAEPG